jgi:hypothetical protein
MCRQFGADVVIALQLRRCDVSKKARTWQEDMA